MNDATRTLRTGSREARRADTSPPGPLVLVRVVEGAEALELVSSAGWAALADRCPWTTSFQRGPFLRTWYAHYGDLHPPLLVVGEDAEGHLVAALPLARAGSGAVLAGTHHAEYHAWLAAEHESDSFVLRALDALDGLSLEGELTFRYLNPGAPLDALLEHDRHGARCFVETVGRSLLDVDDPERGSASLRKKGNRSKLNRLKRLGELTFRRVTDPEDFARTLRDAMPLYDLRQGGAHGVCPFRLDPRKERLHEALFELPDFLHVTELRCGERLVSALLGFRYGDSVGVGVFAHDPRLSAHSPGKLHLLQLAVLLEEEGLRTLDLTPGEGWKERFASRTDQCRVLRVCFDRGRAVRLRRLRRLESHAKRAALALGTTPDAVRAELAAWRRSPVSRLVGLPGRVLAWAGSRDDVEVLSLDPRAAREASSSGALSPDVDDLDAVLECAERRGTLDTSLRRLENGGVAYVERASTANTLVGWLYPAPQRSFDGPLERRLRLLPGTAVVELEPGGASDARRELLARLVVDAARDHATRRIRMLVPAGDTETLGLAHEVGFEHEYLSVVERRLGRAQHRTVRRPEPRPGVVAQVKRAVYRLARWCGAFALARRLTGDRLRILCYHGFSLEGESSFYPRLFMDPDTFARRLEVLVEDGYTVLPLDEAVRRLEDGTLPPAAVAITIDDGPYSVPGRAASLLARHELPATVYQTTYYTDHQRPVFRMACQYMVWRSTRPHVELDGLVPGVGGRLELDTEAHLAPLLWEVIHHAETELDAEARTEVARELGHRLGVAYDLVADSRLVGLASHAELKSLIRRDIDVQLHTHRHRFPADRDVVVQEIEENRESLASVAGSELVHFCYPSNEWYPEQLPWLRELGVRSATTCVTGLNPPGTDPLLLRRFLDGECVSEIEFRAELSGLPELLRRLLRRA